MDKYCKIYNGGTIELDPRRSKKMIKARISYNKKEKFDRNTIEKYRNESEKIWKP